MSIKYMISLMFFTALSSNNWCMHSPTTEPLAEFFALQEGKNYSPDFITAFKHEIKNAKLINKIYSEITQETQSISVQARNQINTINRLPEKIEVTDDVRNFNAHDYAENFAIRCKQFEEEHLRKPLFKPLKKLHHATLAGAITTLLTGSGLLLQENKNSHLSMSFWLSLLTTTVIGAVYGVRVATINTTLNNQNDAQILQSANIAFTKAAQLIKKNNIRYN